jgi:hypothetical protein
MRGLPFTETSPLATLVGLAGFFHVAENILSNLPMIPCREDHPIPSDFSERIQRPEANRPALGGVGFVDS